MNTLELVQKLNQIIVSGDNAGLSDIIADDIVFDGPLFKASGKKEFMSGFQRWVETKKTCALLKQFAEDSFVASFYEIGVETPAGIVTLKEADWIEARDGKIATIKVYFDPRELLKATGR